MRYYIVEKSHDLIINTIVSNTYTPEIIHEYMTHEFGVNWRDKYKVIKGEEI